MAQLARCDYCKRHQTVLLLKQLLALFAYMSAARPHALQNDGIHRSMAHVLHHVHMDMWRPLWNLRV